MESQKNVNVPLEDALTIAGDGFYTMYLTLVAGLAVFAAITNVVLMSVVVTAAGCDLDVTSYQKGILTSIGYLGMIFSSHLFGVLADTFGRKRLIVICSAIMGIVTLFSSLAPNVEALMVAFFINGFLGGGIFTPAYVYVSEFCPLSTRARGMIIVASCGSLANCFLLYFAWLVLPIDIHYELPFGVEFNSWRLFLALLCLPPLLCSVVFNRVPETPKFLLNDGKHRETLEILKHAFAVNSRKTKEEFPVLSVCLDGIDTSEQKLMQERPTWTEYLQKIVQQTVVLFTPKYLFYTFLSCTILLIAVGNYNITALWMPEQFRLLGLFANSHSYYNVTLCDVMSLNEETADMNLCAPNYEAYIPGLIIAAVQFIFFFIVNILVKFIGPKLLLVIFSALSAVGSIVVMFSRTLYITIVCLGIMLNLLYTMYPVCLSVIVSWYPTNLRSNASSIAMLFSRAATVVGAQALGAFFHSKCEISYSVLSALLVVQVILCIIMPVKSSQ